MVLAGIAYWLYLTVKDFLTPDLNDQYLQNWRRNRNQCMSDWQLATFIAWENQKGQCTICGNRISLRGGYIGHHKRNRSQGGESTPSNCECRHVSCERLAHKITKCGNPTQLQVKAYVEKHGISSFNI